MSFWDGPCFCLRRAHPLSTSCVQGTPGPIADALFHVTLRVSFCIDWLLVLPVHCIVLRATAVTLSKHVSAPEVGSGADACLPRTRTRRQTMESLPLIEDGPIREVEAHSAPPFSPQLLLLAVCNTRCRDMQLRATYLNNTVFELYYMYFHLLRQLCKLSLAQSNE